MCYGQIRNVDVVANAGSIRSRIVRAEDLRFLLPAESGIEHQRYQVRLRVVILTYIPIGIRAGGIEIAEREVFDSVDLPKPLQGALEGKLGLAIWIDGMLRSVFADWHLIG